MSHEDTDVLAHEDTEVAEVDALLFRRRRLQKAARAFSELEASFQQATARTRTPSVLKRDVNGVLPIQAGRLLCDCWDHGLFSSLFYVDGHGTPEWDLRMSSPGYLRGLAVRVLQDGCLDGAPTESVEAAKAILELPEVRSTAPSDFDFAYLFTWFAFIRWRLASLHASRFRPDWKKEFAPEVDRLRRDSSPQKPFSPFSSPVSTDDQESILWRLDVSADIQAAACGVMAEMMQDEAERVEYRIKSMTEPNHDDSKRQRASRGPSVEQARAYFLALLSLLPGDEHEDATTKWPAKTIQAKMADILGLDPVPSVRTIQRMLTKERFRPPKGAKASSGEHDGIHWDDPDDQRQRQLR